MIYLLKVRGERQSWAQRCLRAKVWPHFNHLGPECTNGDKLNPELTPITLINLIKP